MNVKINLVCYQRLSCEGVIRYGFAVVRCETAHKAIDRYHTRCSTLNDFRMVSDMLSVYHIFENNYSKFNQLSTFKIENNS